MRRLRYSYFVLSSYSLCRYASTSSAAASAKLPRQPHVSERRGASPRSPHSSAELAVARRPGRRDRPRRLRRARTLHAPPARACARTRAGAGANLFSCTARDRRARRRADVTSASHSAGRPPRPEPMSAAAPCASGSCERSPHQQPGEQRQTHQDQQRHKVHQRHCQCHALQLCQRRTAGGAPASAPSGTQRRSRPERRERPQPCSRRTCSSGRARGLRSRRGAAGRRAAWSSTRKRASLTQLTHGELLRGHARH